MVSCEKFHLVKQAITHNRYHLRISLSIRPSYGARGEEIFSPFFASIFPLSPETPDTQAISESWLDPSTTNIDINIPGYVVFR